MQHIAFALAGLVLAASAHADIAVKNAWVRATVMQQKATGAFMQLQSDQDVKLVAARSPLADVVELHEMVLRDEKMHMHAVPEIELPAGQPVPMQPGHGYHIMLLDLKQQVHVGTQVPLTLVFEGRDGRREAVDIQATARVLNAAAQ